MFRGLSLEFPILGKGQRIRHCQHGTKDFPEKQYLTRLNKEQDLAYGGQGNPSQRVVKKGTKAGMEGTERNPAKLGSGVPGVVVGLEESLIQLTLILSLELLSKWSPVLNMKCHCWQSFTRSVLNTSMWNS